MSQACRSSRDRRGLLRMVCLCCEAWMAAAADVRRARAIQRRWAHCMQVAALQHACSRATTACQRRAACNCSVVCRQRVCVMWPGARHAVCRQRCCGVRVVELPQHIGDAGASCARLCAAASCLSGEWHAHTVCAAAVQCERMCAMPAKPAAAFKNMHAHALSSMQHVAA